MAAAHRIGLECPLCQSTRWTPLSIPPYARCVVCRLVANIGVGFRVPYDGEYFTSHTAESGRRDFQSHASVQLDIKRFSRELNEFLGPPKRLLDIGSATGSFLRIASAAGWEAIGLEISSAARAIAAEDGQYSVATFEDARLHGVFDVITMHHVLEHLEDPVLALARAAELLVPRGRLLVEVPNWASLERRASGSGWVDLRPEQHLWHFDPDTLARALRKAGLQIVRMTTLGDPVPSRISLLTAIGIPLQLAVLVARRVPGKGGSGGSPSRVNMKDSPTAVRVGDIVARVEELLLRKRWGKRLVALAEP